MMQQRIYIKIALVLTLGLVLNACGGNNSSPLSLSGLDRIIEYTQNGGTTPTRQDYLDARVTGIDSEEKLAEINEVVERLLGVDVDTTEEVQALVNALGFVLDITPPTITIKGSHTEMLILGTVYIDAGATAIDDIDGDLNVSSTGEVNSSKLGNYSIAYSASDSAGNESTASRMVNVVRVENFTITHNGTTYGVVESPYSERLWLDKNLGALQVCANLDDENCYGDYYQWGRNFDGHQEYTSNTTNIQAINIDNVGHGNFIISEIKYNNDWTKGAEQRQKNWSKIDSSSICPKYFRVPTITELKAELEDENSAEIKDSADAFNSFLKLPSAGNRTHSAGNMIGLGAHGRIWTSSVLMKDTLSDGVYFDASSVIFGNTARSAGLSVRCIKDYGH